MLNQSFFNLVFQTIFMFPQCQLANYYIPYSHFYMKSVQVWRWTEDNSIFFIYDTATV